MCHTFPDFIEIFYSLSNPILRFKVIFKIIPSRVPRVIGREGSMVNLIKEKTGCNITIGQNGWIWIKGPTTDDEIKARNAIEFVTSKVYVNGLTDKVEEWFSQQK